MAGGTRTMECTTVYLTAEQLASLKWLSEQRGRPMSEFIREAVDALLDAYDAHVTPSTRPPKPPTVEERLLALEQHVRELRHSAHEHERPAERGVIWSNRDG